MILPISMLFEQTCFQKLLSLNHVIARHYSIDQSPKSDENSAGVADITSCKLQKLSEKVIQF